MWSCLWEVQPWEDGREEGVCTTKAGFVRVFRETEALRTYCFCLVAKSCPTLGHVQLSDSMDCGLPGSSVHGILQARILEWVAISFSRGSLRPRDQNCVCCIAGKFFTAEPPGRPIRDIHVYIFPIYIYFFPVCIIIIGSRLIPL